MNLHDIGTKIKSLRKEQNMTQESLAKLAGISRVTMGKVERGHFGSISVNTLNVIISALGYELDIKHRNGFGLITLDQLAE